MNIQYSAQTLRVLSVYDANRYLNW